MSGGGLVSIRGSGLKKKPRRAPLTRSEAMSRVWSKNTKPELNRQQATQDNWLDCLDGHGYTVMLHPEPWAAGRDGAKLEHLDQR